MEATANINLLPARNAISSSLIGFGVEFWEDGEVIGDHITISMADLIAEARDDAGLEDGSSD